MLNKGLLHFFKNKNAVTNMTSKTFNSFGILSEYNERANKKNLHKGHLVSEKPQFWVTSSRPGNFGDHIDFKTNIDNWFDENRVHNEHETDIRRTQIYLLNAVYYAGLLNFARIYAMGVIGRLNGWKRYDRDTYLEIDISELPPGEVMQCVWNGIPIFVRRLTPEEVKNENELPTDTIIDKGKEVILNEAGTGKVLVQCSLHSFGLHPHSISWCLQRMGLYLPRFSL